jgi:hypothetical protein
VDTVPNRYHIVDASSGDQNERGVWRGGVGGMIDAALYTGCTLNQVLEKKTCTLRRCRR